MPRRAPVMRTATPPPGGREPRGVTTNALLPQAGTRLALPAQLAHAVRVRSVSGGLLAVVDACGHAIAHRWWTQTAPWYAGRLVQTLGLAVKVDGSFFEVKDRYFAGQLWLGAYETLERYAVAKHLPRDRPVVELGASIGVVSCLTNKLLHRSIVHVCVEANPALLPVLEAHRARNGCSFEIVHGAIAYGVDRIDFGIAESTAAGSLSTTADTVGTVSVPATSLKEVLRNAGIERCSLVCDIEGAEEALVRHDADVLRERVDTLVVEVHRLYLGDNGVAALADSLRQLGFEFVWEKNDRWVLNKIAGVDH
jgi:FkbM family methyltransferase